MGPERESEECDPYLPSISRPSDPRGGMTHSPSFEMFRGIDNGRLFNPDDNSVRWMWEPNN